MCGICGVVLTDSSERTLTREMIVRMRDTLAHRGPDGAGVFIGARAGLGHRRLSIIDVAAGQQPMANHDSTLHIVYNGEVYNHADLRGTLEQRGFQYRTRCDTETILHLFEADGPHAWPQLRGMFALGIWDSRTRELVLVRDRLGVKPLYYSVLPDGSLAFASEIKGLLATGWVNAELNTSALPEYLANHATFGDETLFAGVHRLAPGHALYWRSGHVRIERFWELSFQSTGSAARSTEEYVAEYDERFREAVRLRLMSDVPLGSLLSGGIDSASITAVMSQLMQEPVKTFSVAFSERGANELAFARLVAKRFRTDHHEIMVEPTSFFEALPQMVWQEDEPIAHPASIPLYFVSRLAAEHVKVVLTGEGADETLAGYSRYRTTMVNLGLGERYEAWIPDSLRTLVRRGVESLPLGWSARRKLMRTFLALPADLTTLYFDNFAVFSRARQAALLSPEFRSKLGDSDPYARLEAHFRDNNASSRLEQLLFVDIKTYLHELLMKQDQMSMAASIESRVPFLDHPLVEYTAQLPARMKLRGLTTKYVLRKAMANVLPREILTRRKMGFPVPVGAWLRGPFRPLLDEFVLGERVQARGMFDRGVLKELVARHLASVEDHSERLWSLINLEVWCRIQLDGESVEDIRMTTGPRVHSWRPGKQLAIGV